MSEPISVWRNYKIKLHNLSDEQKQRIFDISNVFRYCYNWALNYFNTTYKETGAHKTFIDATSEFTKFRNQPGNEWLLDYNVGTCRGAIKNAKNGLEKFFKHLCRYPRFKSRKHNKGIRFKVPGDRVSFRGENGRYIHIPGMGYKKKDFLDCKRHRIPIGPGIEYKNVYISFDGLHYWVTMSVKETIESPEPIENTTVIGVDVGVRKSAVLSNGMVFERPDEVRLGILEHRRRKLQSVISRDINRRYKESIDTKTKYHELNKSNNQIKRERKLKITNKKIANLYDNHYHQISRKIADLRPSTIVLETISVRQMQRREPYMAPIIVPARLAKLVEYIEYKCENAGINVIRADNNYPSSQICTRCGKRHKLEGEEIFICPYCGYKIDRDYNAALNLRNFGLKAR